MKIKTILVTSIIILTGCSGDILESKIKETNSGTYKVSGTQVELRYDFPWPSWGGKVVILSRDTTEIEFTVEIEYPQGKQDTVRFKGLEGADTGKYQAVYRKCSNPKCYADAELIGSELKFDLGAPSGAYTGHGYLGAENLILETHFEYRAIGIDYHLQGEKVEE